MTTPTNADPFADLDGPIVILPEEWDLLCATETVRAWIDKHGTLDVVPENEDALALLTGLHDQESEAWRVLREIPLEAIRAYQGKWRAVFHAADVLLHEDQGRGIDMLREAWNGSPRLPRL
jgi:hypothetical protein